VCASFDAITGAEKPCHILQQQQKGRQHKEQMIAGVEKKVMYTVYESKSAKRQAQKGQLQKEYVDGRGQRDVTDVKQT
jgi:hypothetical protein